MTKFRLNHTLLFVLVVAFLGMQWTTSHIHLAAHHDHDGDHHQHHIEIHAHHSVGIHDDAIDFSHQINDDNIVELDPQYSVPKEKKQQKHLTTAITSVFQQLSCPPFISIKLPVILNTKLSHLDRSTINLRAPPHFS